MLTDPTQKIIDAEPSLLDDWVARIPQGRMATPGNLTALVCLLASDVSSHLTAQDIIVDDRYRAV